MKTHHSALRILALTLLLATMPFAARAQTAVPVAYSQEQLGQLLAPVALYPDELLSQILMASTYPQEVQEAFQWQQGHTQLHGDELEAAVELQPWDPSVKSLIVFPEVLAMMTNNLQWTEQLGEAFLANEGAVMDSVQDLRQMASSSGQLVSTPQADVYNQDDIISIQPANPQVVYVPVYDPAVVYGAWPYPRHPPYYFRPAPGYYYGSPGVVFGYGPSVIILAALWDWHRWDWHHHRIIIDDRRYEVINRGHPPHTPGQWAHNPHHRQVDNTNHQQRLPGRYTLQDTPNTVQHEQTQQPQERWQRNNEHQHEAQDERHTHSTPSASIGNVPLSSQQARPERHIALPQGTPINQFQQSPRFRQLQQPSQVTPSVTQQPAPVQAPAVSPAQPAQAPEVPQQQNQNSRHDRPHRDNNGERGNHENNNRQDHDRDDHDGAHDQNRNH